jgi:hypothetical protein
MHIQDIEVREGDGGSKHWNAGRVSGGKSWSAQHHFVFPSVDAAMAPAELSHSLAGWRWVVTKLAFAGSAIGLTISSQGNLCQNVNVVGFKASTALVFSS